MERQYHGAQHVATLAVSGCCPPCQPGDMTLCEECMENPASHICVGKCRVFCSNIPVGLETRVECTVLDMEMTIRTSATAIGTATALCLVETETTEVAAMIHPMVASDHERCT